MWYDIIDESYISHRVVTYVIVTVTQSGDTEKNVEGSKTDNII